MNIWQRISQTVDSCPPEMSESEKRAAMWQVIDEAAEEAARERGKKESEAE